MDNNPKTNNAKVALVTGASRGIGAAITKTLSDNNYYVFGIYLQDTSAAQKMADYSPNIDMQQCDISDETQIIKAVQDTIKAFGSIDLLVNNAGVILGGKVEDFTLDDWNYMLDVNLTAKFLLAKYAIPHLKKSKGTIINISSRAGLDEFVFSDYVSYCVSSAAINNFTKTLAMELKAENISVYGIIPTITDTDRFRETFSKEEQRDALEKGIVGKPEDVANVVTDIVKGRHKTGEIIIDERVYR